MPKRIVIEELAALVREADKPLTEPEIAERYGVTRPAVGNHREELRDYPGIQYADVGRATAYWWEPVNGESAEASSPDEQQSRERPTDEELHNRRSDALLTDEEAEAFREVLDQAESDRIEAEAREAHSSDRATHVRDRSLVVVELSLLLVVGGSLWLGATALLSTVGLPWAFVYPGLFPLAFGVVGIAGGTLGVIRSVWVATAAERLTGTAGDWLGGQI